MSEIVLIFWATCGPVIILMSPCLTVSLGMLDTELIDPIRVKFLIGKTSLQTEVDTGATVSCMPLLVYKEKLS